MSVSVKAFLENPDGKPEIRRFPIDNSVLNNYSAFKEKLTAVFPAIQQKPITTYWKDEEGDEIVVSSDEELKYMFEVSKNDVLKIHVKVVENNDSDGEAMEHDELHPNVVCDGCNGEIRGYRFKCMQCEDYDLCSSCKTKGAHKIHYMMRIATPAQAPFHFGHRKWWPHGGRHGRKHCGRHGHHQRHKSKDDSGNEDSTFQPGNILNFERFMSALSGMRMQSDGEETADPNRADNNMGQDFLRNIGETVADILFPLGIDVEVDVEHKGQRERCGMRKEPNVETKTTETKDPEPQPGPSTTGVDTETGMQETIPTAPAVQETIPTAPTVQETIPTAPQIITVDQEQPKIADKSPSETQMTMDVDDWTLIANNNDAVSDRPDANTMQPINTATDTNMASAELHPDPKISKSLEHMLSMGFNNEGGWLTHLLELKDGDIGKVLDVLQPVKQMA